MWLLGVVYMEGIATAANHTQARYWLESAVARSSPGRHEHLRCSTMSMLADAMHWLGVMDEYGLGIGEPNFTSAASWYKQSALEGNSDAAFNLGLMHAYGRGCNQDFQRALGFFHQAATKIHAGAMFYIGIMHLYGQGVPVNYDMARAWCARHLHRTIPFRPGSSRPKAPTTLRFAERCACRRINRRTRTHRQASEARRELEHSMDMAKATRQGDLEKFARIFDPQGS